MSAKIDFVIPWVDGSDPEWQKERAKYSEAGEIISSQYRDWGLLKYWFRGVEKFAPWVDKIYFVTWGHLPKFLNIDHPKLVIIKHEDFIPKKYLPTFSSNVIENNIHRIKGLSEQFVLFNDDVFLTKKVSKEDFFENGIPKDTAVLKPIDPARYDSIASTMINNIGIINENFNKKKSIKENWTKWINPKNSYLNLLNIMFTPWPRFIGLYEQHTANSYLKSTFTEVWEKEEEHLNNTCLNKVRNVKTDVNQWLFKNWRIAKGQFIPRSINFSKYKMIKNFEDVNFICKYLQSEKYKIVCINDNYKGKEIKTIQKVVSSAFDEFLVRKSNYEK